MTSFNNYNQQEDGVDYEGVIFDGTVVDNADPEKNERIRVTIPGLFEGDTESLPWCIPEKNSPFGMGPGYGVFGVPKIGSTVTVELQNGDANYPMYRGGLLKEGSVPTEFDGNPDIWGFKDPAGNKLVINLAEGTAEFRHKSGTGFIIEDNGNVNTTIVGDWNLSVSGQINSSASQWNHSGEVRITGNLGLAGNLYTFNGTYTASFSGNINTTGDVIAGSISLRTHVHGGVEAGSSSSGAPV